MFARNAGLASRLLQGLFVAWAAATLAFVTLQLTPGDPVDVLLINATDASAEDREEIRAFYGLDQPVPVQYISYLSKLAQGDLGYSYRQQRPVATILADAVWPTLRLASLALLMGTALVFGAALAAGPTRSLRARLVGAVEIMLIAVPAFWLGVALLTLFSFELGWLPSSGDASFSALVLPAATLGLVIGARISRVFRRGIESAEAEPFVLSARARGLNDGAVRRRHTSRHALIGTLTIGGSAFADLLGGAVLIEAIFSRPGLGRELAGAVISKDIPVVMALVVLSGLAVAFVNIAIDAAYGRIDPRVAKA